jgi:hypothetical protein
MKNIRSVLALSLFSVLSVLQAEVPSKEDDYSFRNKRSPTVNLDAEGKHLSVSFIVHVTTLSSPLVIKEKEAFSVALYNEENIKIGECELVNISPHGIAARGGNFTFPKRQQTKITVEVIFPVEQLRDGAYRMHIDAIHFRHRGHAETLTPSMETELLWSKVYKIMP